MRNMKQTNPDSLLNAVMGEEYIIKDLKTEDPDMEEFLLTLGCFKGQVVTVISILSNSYVVTLKDARYSMDKSLAGAILIYGGYRECAQS